TFFIDFSTISLLPYFLIALLLSGRALRESLSFAFVFLFPYVFFLFFYSFINYVFKGDALYFLREHIPTLALLWSAKAKPHAVHVIGLLAYLVGFFFMRGYRLFWAIPIFYLLSLFYFNPVKELTDFGVSPLFLFALFLVMGMNLSRKSARLFLILYLILLNLLFLFTPDKTERNFVKALTGREFERNLLTYRKVGEFVNSLEGSVFMDDEGLYPAVLFVDEPSRLILPYRSEYYTFLFSLKGNVDWALVKTFYPRDDLFANYKESVRDFLDGCFYYGEVENVKVFRCS
ncbi:MAG: hypothetical protein GXO04_04035, partial [Aquificae bacterium]|nr:hypothetical protein [Aquificota bacterium]